jgi:NADPH-dependent ferric siderophore reductase
MLGTVVNGPALPTSADAAGSDMSPMRTSFRTDVVRTERLTPDLVRVVVTGDDLAEFPDGEHTDRYVKLIFPRPDSPPEPEEGWWSLPPEQRPVFRTYTVRAFDREARELTIEFVTHGDEGVAGPWAAAAQPGDQLTFSGPGGAYRPLAESALHLLVGDEAALPAIASAVEALPHGARAVLLAEVEDVDHELAFDVPDGVIVDVQWVHRSAGGGPEALLDAVRALELPDEGVQPFVHGELHVVRAIKRHLLQERGVDPAICSASGYWRRGKDEDGFQAEKRELAQAENAAAG